MSSNVASSLVLVATGFAFVGLGGMQSPASASTNTCPSITRVVASPVKVSVGHDVEVSVAAEDGDGDTIVYLWTGTGGSFADASAPTTTYRCEQEGGQAITITVTDPQSCAASFTARVVCVAAPTIVRFR